MLNKLFIRQILLKNIRGERNEGRNPSKLLPG